MKIIIFCTGSRCKYLLEKNKVALQHNEVVAFADNDKKKHGKDFCGRKIISPQEIKNYNYDIIYVANIRCFDEIYLELTRDLKINPDKIKAENYLQIWFSRKEYEWHYNKLLKLNIVKEKGNYDIDKCRIVIYTAIFGEYDDLKDPEYIDQNIDYICYTDNPDLKSNIWEMRCVTKTLNGVSSRRAAKIYKILPHMYFCDYDISVWIDGSAKIIGDIKMYIKGYMKYSNILFCPHPWNDCIYQEAEYTFKNRLFEELEKLKRQMEVYEKQNMPKHNGIISGGFIIRRHNDPVIKKNMVDWWKEIENYSTQDQISFAYIAWKNHLIYDVSDLWIYRNPYVIFERHLLTNQ